MQRQELKSPDEPISFPGTLLPLLKAAYGIRSTKESDLQLIFHRLQQKQKIQHATIKTTERQEPTKIMMKTRRDIPVALETFCASSIIGSEIVNRTDLGDSALIPVSFGGAESEVTMYRTSITVRRTLLVLILVVILNHNRTISRVDSEMMKIP